MDGNKGKLEQSHIDIEQDLDLIWWLKSTSSISLAFKAKKGYKSVKFEPKIKTLFPLAIFYCATLIALHKKCDNFTTWISLF